MYYTEIKKLLLSVSLYSYSPATLNFLSFFLKLLNKPNDYIQSWNRQILVGEP